jgi:hypothetical protein
MGLVGEYRVGPPIWQSSQADKCRKVQTPQGVTTKQLDFTPMDAFISHVLEAFRADAETAAQVFPPSARVLLSFCDRVANDVVSQFYQALIAAKGRLANTSPLCSHRLESSRSISSYKLRLLRSFRHGSSSM